jgi:hypothetical protein
VIIYLILFLWSPSYQVITCFWLQCLIDKERELYSSLLHLLKACRIKCFLYVTEVSWNGGRLPEILCFFSPIALTYVSSRIYFQSNGQVPFDWEVQPGEPKSPPKSHAIPPLSPPPAFQSAQVLQDSPREKVPTPTRSHQKLSRRQMRSWRCVFSYLFCNLSTLNVSLLCWKWCRHYMLLVIYIFKF